MCCADRFVVRRFQFHAHQGLVTQSRQRHRQRIALDVPSATDQHTATLGARKTAQQLAETPTARLHALCANLLEVFHLHCLVTRSGSIVLTEALVRRPATTALGCRTLSVMNATTACKSIVHALCCAAIANWITGCGSTGQKPALVASSSNPKQIVKSDIDRVLEAHHREMFASLERLADKLEKQLERESSRVDSAIEQNATIANTARQSAGTPGSPGSGLGSFGDLLRVASEAKKLLLN